MKITQKLSSATTSGFDQQFRDMPEKHIVERLTFESRADAWEYVENNDIQGGIPMDKNGKSYITRQIWEAPTWENKAKYRMEFCRSEQVYTICAACGRELHEHQAESHTKTQWGIIGPECIKRVRAAGLISV